MKVTIEEQKLYDDFTASVFQRGYEKGKEDATISYQNTYNEGYVDGYAKGLNDRKKEIEKAKREGYDEGVTDTIFNTDTYTQGLNDAWECAKKIMQLPNDTQELFYLSAKEAIAKIKEYEEEQQNIKSCDIKFRVGDIVILNRDVCGYKNAKGSKGIIEKIAFDDGIKEEKAFVNFVGGLNGWYRLRYLTNTGKHYQLIKEILAEIRGD
jgi:hypothetical protein